MKFNVKYSVLLMIFSCSNVHHKEEKVRYLFSKIEKHIIEEQPDWDSIENKSYKQYYEKIYLLNEKKIKSERFDFDDQPIGRTILSVNQKFELRSELASDGTVKSKGVVYNGKCYGPWEVYFPDGKVMYRGYRYKSEYFDNRIRYENNGNVKEKIEYGNENYYDSLLSKFGDYEKLFN